MSETSRPYRMLGGQLRLFRESRSESLAEASGAIEIEMEQMQKFERGEVRPSEELLLLFISHFKIEDKDASILWKLAGYEDLNDDLSSSNFGNIGEQIKQVALLMPSESKIVYTDMVHVMANNYGVVINFMQTNGPTNQNMAVARVGMSREHAQSIVELLQQTLNQANESEKPRLLPKPPTNQQN